MQEQESRYAVLRQGERESIHVFKVRFDNQIKANQGAGMIDVTESKRALEFIYRLDSRRYKPMLVSMRNDALRELPDAYPQTLAAAFRIAAGWLSDEHSGVGGAGEVNNAFVTDTAVTGTYVPARPYVRIFPRAFRSEQYFHITTSPALPLSVI